MKLTLLTSVLLLNFNLILAQPISTPSIEIKNIKLKNKSLCSVTSNGIDYRLLKKDKCRDCNNAYSAIRVNKFYNFTYKRDTMRLKLLFDSHSPFQFKINKLLFQKGNFIIDLKKCKKVLNSDYYPIIISELPYACKAYTKEDKEP